MRKSELMGIGLAPEVARRLANEPNVVTAQGSSIGSAFQLGGDQYLVTITASNGGAGIVLPAVGGFTGCYLGDDFIVNNQLSAAATVYATGGVTISASGANTTGTTGISVSSHTSTQFYALTATSWLGVKGQ
jgi:hypothetical protein